MIDSRSGCFRKLVYILYVCSLQSVPDSNTRQEAMVRIEASETKPREFGWYLNYEIIQELCMTLKKYVKKQTLESNSNISQHKPAFAMHQHSTKTHTHINAYTHIKIYFAHVHYVLYYHIPNT